jgi:hypothetical protein
MIRKFLCSVAALIFALPTRGEDPAGLLIAVGDGGRRIVSRDGINWENDQRGSTTGNDETLSDIAFGVGKFVAVGGGAGIGRILTTRDGREWRELPEVRGHVATITFGHGRFIAGHGAELMFSTDGESFTSGGRLEWDGLIHPRRSACGDTEAGFRTVIIGDLDLAGKNQRTSWRGVTGDGTRWEHAELDTPAALDIAYGSGHFVVVGPGGLIESSHDGETWQRHDTGTRDEFSRIVWTGRRFLVSGGTVAWSSPDGLEWKAEPFAIPCALLGARDGRLGIGVSPSGIVFTSGDLRTWRPQALPAGPPLRAVAFGAP